MSDNLHQPIRTLSGGETVKLALAKMALLAPARDRIVIASPFSWLSSDNRTFLEQLASICHDSSAALELLALTGEDNIDPIRESDLVEGTRRHGIRFSLSFRDVFIQLGASLPAFRARKTLARVAGSLGDLSSPCLFVGQNGQGKSLVAKVLSGAISCDGHVHIQAGDNTAPPRLLFQDIMVQTLSRPFTKLSAFSHRGNGIHPHRLFYQIRDRYHQVMEKIGGRLPDQESPHNSGDHTLLDIKIMLAAARLCGSPGILILDEPDWGLSRSTAIALVTTLIEVSHTMHIPVILISHKPWWRPLSGSLVHVSKSGLDKREGAVCRFTIDLHRGEVR